ncbi:hypothetical protein DUNSADRAFT_12783, partial [Dunaliella salina]
PRRAAAAASREMCAGMAPEEVGLSDSSQGYQPGDDEQSLSSSSDGESGAKPSSQRRAGKAGEHARQGNRSEGKGAQTGKTKQGQGSRDKGGDQGKQGQGSRKKEGGQGKQGQTKRGPGRPPKNPAPSSQPDGPDYIPATQQGEASAATAGASAKAAPAHEDVEDPTEIMNIVHAEEERAAEQGDEPKTLWFKPATLKFVELLAQSMHNADKQMDSGKQKTQKSWLSGVPEALMKFMQ